MERKSRILENIVVLGIGIVLLCLYGQKELYRWIISLAGIMFLAPAVIGMFGQFNQDRKAREEALRTGTRRRGRMNSLMSWITCVAGVVLGVVFIVLWQTFEPILVFLMGALVLAGGVYHFYALAFGYTDVKFPGYFYIFPALLVIGGGVMLFAKPDQSTTAMITGIGMILFAVTSILEMTYAGTTKKLQAVDRDDRRSIGEGKSKAVAKRSDDYYVGDDKYTQDVDPE